VPEFPITVNIQYVKPEVLEKVRSALLKMHNNDLDAIKAIDPKYEKWIKVSWQDYQPVKETIDKVYGQDFYKLQD
jgi:hypothetical protein